MSNKTIQGSWSLITAKAGMTMIIVTVLVTKYQFRWLQNLLQIHMRMRQKGAVPQKIEKVLIFHTATVCSSRMHFLS